MTVTCGPTSRPLEMHARCMRKFGINRRSNPYPQAGRTCAWKGNLHAPFSSSSLRVFVDFTAGSWWTKAIRAGNECPQRFAESGERIHKTRTRLQRGLHTSCHVVHASQRPCRPLSSATSAANLATATILTPKPISIRMSSDETLHSEGKYSVG